MVGNAHDRSHPEISLAQLRRYCWPLLTLLGGFAVYYFVFRALVDPLDPSLEVLKGFSYQFLWEGEKPASQVAVVGADMAARYRHAVPSVLLAISFCSGLIVAFGYVLPRYGRTALACGFLAVPAGAYIGFIEQHKNITRMAVADCPPGTGVIFCPLDQAVSRGGGSSFTSDALAHIRFLTDFNSIVSVAAIFLLGICFVFLARSAEPTELHPAQLRERRKSLEATLIVTGLVLVFSVATTHGFYNLASALMQPEYSKSVAQLASAGSTYWGAVYTTVLIVVVSPAIISIARDCQFGAEAALPKGSAKERRDWKEQYGLAISLKDMLGAALASFAPVLTAPSLDLIQTILGTE